MNKVNLDAIFKRLFKFFGPQRWWPADTQFEVIVGAILTQNTSWQNVEKAINNLKSAKMLSVRKLHNISIVRLARLIRPAGYFNVKAARLKNFVNFVFSHYGGSLKKMFRLDIDFLRSQLLSINGIGEETADSIILYAAELPVFVIDSYTKRVFSRHKIIKKDATYAQAQKIFMTKLPKDAKMFNEFHALIVRLAKEICLKTKPKCNICPITSKRGIPTSMIK